MLQKFDSGVKVIQTKTHSNDDVIVGNNKSRCHFVSTPSSAAFHSRSVLVAATYKKMNSLRSIISIMVLVRVLEFVLANLIPS
jgi:hypothetical protein